MAEFKEVCKQWRRMCEEIQRCSAENDECCALQCALGNNPVCGELIDATDKDLENAENVIMKWAKEHPEPVYPTWAEYLMHVYQDVSYARILGETIPADIAQKLGIEPKEG